MDALIVIVLVLFAAIGAPLFAIFGAASMMLFSQEENGSITFAVVDVFSERFADSPQLVTLPLFTFAGYLLAESGTPTRLVRVTRALFGWLPGGVAVVCLLASAFFTTFTGGSGITIVAIGGLLFPALLQDRFSERFSLGLVTTGGSLGLLFPPSIPIVLYAVVGGILIDKLFLAGLVPGLISVAILVAYAFVVALLKPKGATREGSGEGVGQFLRFIVVLAFTGAALLGGFAGLSYAITGEPLSLLLTGIIGFAIQIMVIVGAFLAATYATSGEARAALLEGSWEVLLPFVLVSGLLSGALRIHEAAAFTALYVIVIEVFIYKNIKIKTDLPRVIKNSMTMLGAILAILAAALGFTGYLIQAGVPDTLANMLGEIVPPGEWWSWIAFMLLLNIFLIIVGMLMDIFSAIVVVVPLIVPIAMQYDIDPYHLGIVFLLNLEIGYLTPPVGLNLFISAFRFQKPVTELYRAVLPFIGLLLIAVGVTAYVPRLSTFLTDLSSTQELTSEDIENMDDPEPDDSGGGTLDDLDDEGGETLDTLDDLEGGEGETLDELMGDDGPTEGETLDDLMPEPAPVEDPPPREGETLDDLQ
jgi:C4-dicarboxylate transporter DctM subunit